MNRFRTRKTSSSGKSSREGSRRPSIELDAPPPMPSLTSRPFSRKKKNIAAIPEPKPDFDIALALPSSDDFRTSLLLPKLSARFSMLKEQDDPNSKLGKANDDSVLFPKRLSRLDLFSSNSHGHAGLADIAEVDSVRGSIRPPFASSRTESYGSENLPVDDGSIMGRARPGEGNTMFGGRQKIYRIPVNGAGSVKNFGMSDDEAPPVVSNMGGKPLYESDTALSTFQKLREQEREEQERASLEAASAERSSKEQDRSTSPPFPKYNRNRETSSSTNSAAPSQSRASTAATSVASQRSIYGGHDLVCNGMPHGSMQPSPAPSDRPLFKARRLYGQGIERDLHDQQSSALQRFGSLSRPRPAPGTSHVGPALQQTRSATSLHDRYQRAGPLYASSSFRAGSPSLTMSPPPRMGDFDLGFGNPSPPPSNTSHPLPNVYGSAPPLSPPLSPDLPPTSPDQTLLANLEPNDVGKATASGAFNRPRRQYDEEQYLKRQFQLHEGRDTPSPQLSGRQSPQVPPSDQAASGRSRNNSMGPTLPHTDSFRHPWMEDRVPRAVPERGASPDPPEFHVGETSPAGERSFFSAMNSGNVSSAPDSDSETDPSSPLFGAVTFQKFPSPDPSRGAEPFQNMKHDPYSDNRSLRSGPQDSIPESQSFCSTKTVTQASVERDAAAAAAAANVRGEPDISSAETSSNSTTRPTPASSGLSGLVRSHLRNDSGQSSIYPEESPRRHRRADVRESIFGHESALEQQDAPLSPIVPTSADSPPPLPTTLSAAARNILEQAAALKNQNDSGKVQQILGTSKAQRVLGGEAPRTRADGSFAWQERPAASGKAVTDNQEKSLQAEQHRRLGNMTDLRGPSKQSAQNGFNGELDTGNMQESQERAPKAMRMLGMDSTMAKSSSTGNTRQPFTPLPFKQPPAHLFVGREQFHDRATPPRTKASGQKNYLPQSISSAFAEPRSPREQDLTTSLTSDRPEQAVRTSNDDSSNATVARDGQSPTNKDNTSRPGPEVMTSKKTGSRNASGYDDNTQAVLSNLNRAGISSSKTFILPSARSQPSSSATATATATASPAPPRTAPPGTPFMINPSSKRSGIVPPISPTSPTFKENVIPYSPSQKSLASSASKNGLGLRLGSSHRQISKYDISEPTFVSCTSSVDTVDLPPGASLKNGMELPPSPGLPPPVPVRDSRRKRAQTLLQSFARNDRSETAPPVRSVVSPIQIEANDVSEEQSSFSADEDEDEHPPSSSASSSAPASKWRPRLRKTSSEANSLHGRAQRQVSGNGQHSPIPAMPMSPVSPMIPGAIDHVPYQAQHDVPASAVMF